MFSAITWEIFISTVVVLVGVYYVITTLLLYHNEIIHWIKSGGQKSMIKVASTEENANNEGMMGSIRNEPIQELRSSTIEAEEINVASVDEQVEEIQPVRPLFNDGLLIGSMADLLQEIKTLIQLTIECKTEKVECVSLFRTLLLRYPQLSNTAYQDVINLYIAEATMNQISFDVTLPEIKTWWEEDNTSKK